VEIGISRERQATAKKWRALDDADCRSAAPTRRRVARGGIISGPQPHVLAMEGNQLGYPEPGLYGDEQEGAVTAADPGVDIRSSEERVGFLGCQELDRSALEPPARDGEHAQSDDGMVPGAESSRVAGRSPETPRGAARSAPWRGRRRAPATCARKVALK